MTAYKPSGTEVDVYARLQSGDDGEDFVMNDEGILNVDWKANNNIFMRGKVSEVKKITVNI